MISLTNKLKDLEIEVLETKDNKKRLKEKVEKREEEIN